MFKEFESVNQTKSLMEINGFKWFPLRYPSVPPIAVRPPMVHPFRAGIETMERFPYSYTSNTLLSMPVMISPVPPVPPPTFQMIAKESSDSIASLERHFMCNLCSSFSTTNVNDLKEHLNIHSAPKRPFVCQICKKVFHFRCLWRNHSVIHMVIKRPNSSKYEKQKPEEVTNECEDNRFECEECGYSFNWKTDLEPHMRLICSTDTIQCPECKYQTSTKTKLQRHEATHMRDRPYGCVECNSTFSQSGSLKGHLIKVHKMSDLLVKCSYCDGFEANNFGPLKSHIEKVHQNFSFGYTLDKGL